MIDPAPRRSSIAGRKLPSGSALRLLRPRLSIPGTLKPARWRRRCADSRPASVHVRFLGRASIRLAMAERSAFHRLPFSRSEGKDSTVHLPLFGAARGRRRASSRSLRRRDGHREAGVFERPGWWLRLRRLENDKTSTMMTTSDAGSSAASPRTPQAKSTDNGTVAFAIFLLQTVLLERGIRPGLCGLGEERMPIGAVATNGSLSRIRSRSAPCHAVDTISFSTAFRS